MEGMDLKVSTELRVVLILHTLDKESPGLDLENLFLSQFSRSQQLQFHKEEDPFKCKSIYNKANVLFKSYIGWNNKAHGKKTQSIQSIDKRKPCPVEKNF